MILQQHWKTWIILLFYGIDKQDIVKKDHDAN